MLAAEGSPSLDGAPEVPASWTWKLLSEVAQLKGGVTKGRKLAGRRWVTLWASGSWRAVVLGPCGGDSVRLNTTRGDSVLLATFRFRHLAKSRSGLTALSRWIQICDCSGISRP